MSESQDQEDARDHLENCNDDDCSLCDHLMEFYMACDKCGMWGHQDSDGWSMFEHAILCTACGDEIDAEDDNP